MIDPLEVLHASDEEKAKAIKEDAYSAKELPSNSEAASLRMVFKNMSEPIEEGRFKGPREAVVDNVNEASVMARAFNFIGFNVDEIEALGDNKFRIYSKGYYHHVGA